MSDGHTQLCGHPAACVSTGDDGTSFCLACAAIVGQGPWATKVPDGHAMLPGGRVVRTLGDPVLSADGVLLLGGGRYVYSPGGGDLRYCDLVVATVHGVRVADSPRNYYSTRKAAEAAKGKP